MSVCVCVVMWYVLTAVCIQHTHVCAYELCVQYHDVGACLSGHSTGSHTQCTIPHVWHSLANAHGHTTISEGTAPNTVHTVSPGIRSNRTMHIQYELSLHCHNTMLPAALGARDVLTREEEAWGSTEEYIIVSAVQCGTV